MVRALEEEEGCERCERLEIVFVFSKAEMLIRGGALTAQYMLPLRKAALCSGSLSYECVCVCEGDL